MSCCPSSYESTALFLTETVTHSGIAREGKKRRKRMCALFSPEHESREGRKEEEEEEVKDDHRRSTERKRRAKGMKGARGMCVNAWCELPGVRKRTAMNARSSYVRMCVHRSPVECLHRSFSESSHSSFKSFPFLLLLLLPPAPVPTRRLVLSLSVTTCLSVTIVSSQPLDL